jgi:hypothetical protein
MDEVHIKARDHARSPLQVRFNHTWWFCIGIDQVDVQWTAKGHAGFSDATPWMRVNDDYQICNAEQQISDPNSVFSYWQKVLRLRREYSDVLVYGHFELLDYSHAAVVCFRRIGKLDRSSTGQNASQPDSSSTSDAIALIVANFSEEEQAWMVPSDISGLLKGGRAVLSNYDEPMTLVQSDKVSLRPFEAVVILQSD